MGWAPGLHCNLGRAFFRSRAGRVVPRRAVWGLLGAVVGYGLGTWLALQYGPGVFQVTGGSIRATPWLLGVAVVVTPLFTAVASAIPAVAAVAQDPAVTLRAD